MFPHSILAALTLTAAVPNVTGSTTDSVSTAHSVVRTELQSADRADVQPVDRADVQPVERTDARPDSRVDSQSTPAASAPSVSPDASSSTRAEWGDAPPTDRYLSVSAGVALSLDNSLEPITTRQGERVAITYDGDWSGAPPPWSFGRFGFRVLGDVARFQLGRGSLYSLSAGGQFRFVAFNGAVRPFVASGLAVRSLWMPGAADVSGLEMELPLSLGLELHPSEKLVVSLEGDAHSPMTWNNTYVFFLGGSLRLGYRF